MGKLKKTAKKTKTFKQFSKLYFKYLSNVFNKINYRDLDQLILELEELRKNKATLFVIGNGGGAANATTMANDLGFDILKKTKTKNTFKVVSLTDNISVLTAIANDTGYNNIFVNQLKIHFKKNDKLLILSASGNSKNLIKAAQWVKQRSGKVLSLLGFNGGKLKNISNCCVHIKTEKGDYGPVEDIQLIINHVLAHWYQEKINN